ncbi:MAG TPA: SRPBCC domain-containing protein [Puia sp.]|nr:SRPBCC domain-containing protein [Puia sp.]
MSQPLFVKSSISIHAPAARVWDTLTNPLQTKKYMFGCEAISDWKPGSPLTWKGVFNGVELVAVKGNVVSIVPGKSLVYTVIDPNNPNIPDIPENYLTVTCDLTEQGGETLLTVTQGDYSRVADGPARYADTLKGGWDAIMGQIKAVAES